MFWAYLSFSENAELLLTPRATHASELDRSRIKLTFHRGAS